MLYLTRNNRYRYRYRYKTKIEKHNGQWVLGDSEWTEFVIANVPSKTTIHFIRQGVDDYFVTVYEADGSECPGYDRSTGYRRLVRCLNEYVSGRTLLPGDFLQEMWLDNFILRFDGLTFNVTHERVKPFEHLKIRMNSFSGAGWDDFVETAGLENDQKIMFTNLGNYIVSVVMIGGDGLGLSREYIRPTMLRMPGRKVLYRDRDDLRMQHFCSWPNHADHSNEDIVFYTPLCAYVSDTFRLTIKSEFCDSHPMHVYKEAYVVNRDVRYPMKVEMVFHKKKPTKTNHVRLTGDWWGFGYECGFVEPKMLRIKLIRIDPEIVDGIQIQVPIFHVC
ncbi:hypothetical protein Tco_1344670 [Tanacetum coccineum]